MKIKIERKPSQEPVLEQLETAWWVEILTQKPKSTYYFGPFACIKEAELAFPGYLEDLKHEESQGFTVILKHCRPKELTIFEDELVDRPDS